jgi:hypothetical protein
MEKVGIFFGYFEYITAIWHIFGHLVIQWKFGIFSPVLVYCVKKNLATLIPTRFDSNLFCVELSKLFASLEMSEFSAMVVHEKFGRFMAV